MSRVGQRAVNWTVLGLGFAFLYVPVFILMVYSFNESRLATVWSGFSTKWYGELFKDRQKFENDANMSAADKSTRIADIDAKLAVLARQMKP